MYYQNWPTFKGIYSQNNLPDIAYDWDYVVNLVVYKSMGTNWIALYLNSHSVT